MVTRNLRNGLLQNQANVLLSPADPPLWLHMVRLTALREAAKNPAGQITPAAKEHNMLSCMFDYTGWC
jgi:hypothetical protein